MTRRQKKFVIIFSAAGVGVMFMIIMLMLLILAAFKSNPNYYHNVKWTCTNPKIEIVVKSKSYYDENPDVKEEGYWIVGEEKIEVYWQCIPLHHNFYITRCDNDERILIGSYSFNQKTGTLTATGRMDLNFAGYNENEYVTLSFTKTKLQ